MRKRSKSLVLLLAAASAALLSLAFAQPSHAATSISGGPFAIENIDSGMCIQTNPANNGPDIQLVQEPCQSADGTPAFSGNTVKPAQRWFFDPIGNGNYHIINEETLNCMRALNNSDFAAVQTIDCTTISDETFSLNAIQIAGAFEIRSHISGGNRCVDVLEGSRAAGATIDIFHCTTNLSRNQLNGAQLFFIN